MPAGRRLRDRVGRWGLYGVVFGYVGYLLFRPAFERKLWFVLITLVVAALYGTALLWSVVPRTGISWTGHFFGFAGGILTARLSALRLSAVR